MTSHWRSEPNQHAKSTPRIRKSRANPIPPSSARLLRLACLFPPMRTAMGADGFKCRANYAAPWISPAAFHSEGYPCNTRYPHVSSSCFQCRMYVLRHAHRSGVQTLATFQNFPLTPESKKLTTTRHEPIGPASASYTLPQNKKHSIDAGLARKPHCVGHVRRSAPASVRRWGSKAKAGIL